MTRIALLMFLLPACRHTPPPTVKTLQVEEADGLKTADEKEAMRQMAQNFSRVQFEVDSSTLNTDAKEALSANASLMKANGTLKVEVQGHADERGTVDYNLALGQRRATAVVDYLSSQGVTQSHLLVVSYGEERPLSASSGEVAWSQNRRAEFRILTVTPGLSGTTEK